MYQFETKVRVRYAETDRMGYVYYGNYASYFEVARVETIRSLGFSYRKMEDDGIALPVLDFSVKYFKPAFYDDELIIKTTIKTLPQVRIHFFYETYNAEGELLNNAETTLIFFNKKMNKPCAAPNYFIDGVKKYFSEN